MTPICPRPIEFTCVGTRVPLFLEWRLNGTIHGTHIYRGDTRPVNIILDPLLPGVMAQVTSVSPNQDGFSMNITSTLSGSASALDGSSVQCTAGIFTSEVYMVNVIGIVLDTSSLWGVSREFKVCTIDLSMLSPDTLLFFITKGSSFL